MRLRTDSALRESLYGLYVALFKARQGCPDYFTDRRLTTVQTAFMGVEDSGWRVVGITKKALVLLATEDFQKHKLPRKLCRGHIVDRITTTRKLFERNAPMPIDLFFETFIDNDRTVIMSNEENTPGKGFPEFIPIDNPDATLFPNGSLMSWKHRKAERDFLRNLHAELGDGQTLPSTNLGA